MSENETTGEGEQTVESEGKKSRAIAPTTPLQRESDLATRPGFRNPSNARTKAQKKKR